VLANLRVQVSRPEFSNDYALVGEAVMHHENGDRCHPDAHQRHSRPYNRQRCTASRVVTRGLVSVLNRSNALSMQEADDDSSASLAVIRFSV
jgi:hypothetical protein